MADGTCVRRRCGMNWPLRPVEACAVRSVDAPVSPRLVRRRRRAEIETTNRIANLIPKSQSLGRASCQLYRYTTPSNSTPSTTSRAAHPERRLIAHRLANPNLAAKATKAVSDAVERLKQPRELLSRAADAAVECWQHRRACAEEERDRRSGVSVCL